jgi:hypothetical protein
MRVTPRMDLLVGEDDVTCEVLLRVLALQSSSLRSRTGEIPIRKPRLVPQNPDSNVRIRTSLRLDQRRDESQLRHSLSAQRSEALPLCINPFIQAERLRYSGQKLSLFN